MRCNGAGLAWFHEWITNRSGRPGPLIAAVRQTTHDMFENRSSGKTTRDSDRRPIWGILPIVPAATLTFFFAWCVVYGVWNIDSSADGHTAGLVLAIRLFAILVMGIGSVLMGIITIVAVRRYLGLVKETNCSIRGLRPSGRVKDLMNPYAPPTVEDSKVTE